MPLFSSQHFDTHAHKFQKREIHQAFDQKSSLDSLDERKTTFHHCLSFLSFQHSAVHAVEYIAVESVLFRRLDAKTFKVFMPHAFLNDHKATAHGNAICSQSQCRR